MTFSPNADQQIALDKVAAFLDGTDRCFALAGLAGTGKSSIIPSILRMANDRGIGAKIGTPTGKAAAVVNRKLRAAGIHVEATTIHSIAYRPISQITRTDRQDYLGRDVIEPVFEAHPFLANLLIVDEASMVSPRMLERLLQSQAKFLFIGDHGQLPPVESKLISPTLESPNHTLTEIVRQAKDSPIREFAYSVRQGASLRATPEGISLHRVRSTESIAEQCHANGTDMIIVATNRLRAALNSSIRRLRGMTGNTFAEGEQVLICSNSHPHKVFNGEIYTVERIRHSSNRHKEGPILTCDLVCSDTGRRIRSVDLGFQWRTGACFEAGCIAAEYGYALTAHKAQGSQADSVAVINENISWMGEHAPSWRYTAVTRAATDLSVFHFDF